MIGDIFSRRPEDRIFRLLDEERACILAGRLADLAAIVSKREELIQTLAARLNMDPENQEMLLRMQQKLARNAALMRAAIDGMKAAGQRLGDIAQAQNQLSTYSSDGVLTNIGVKVQGVQKRA